MIENCSRKPTLASKTDFVSGSHSLKRENLTAYLNSKQHAAWVGFKQRPWGICNCKRVSNTIKRMTAQRDVP